MGDNGMPPAPGWRKCTAYRRPGAGGRPLALRLSEGLGRTGAPCRIHITNTCRRSYFASAARERRPPHCIALPAPERYDRNGPSPTGRFRRGWLESCPLSRAISSGFATKGSYIEVDPGEA